jgi:hypothetical protein
LKSAYSEEELKSYFASFERMGETSVRAAINSDLWRNEQMRLGAAKEWIPCSVLKWSLQGMQF